MKKLKVLLSVVTMSFVMVGCGGGGGGSSTPAIDNSVYLENQYGYFGEGVVFGNTLVVGVWSFFDRDDDLAYALYGKFDTDGDGFLDSPNNPNRKYIDYGVSQDGRIIRTGGDYSATITFKSILNDWYKVTQSDGSSTTYDCNDVIFDDVYGSHNVVMCPNL